MTTNPKMSIPSLQNRPEMSYSFGRMDSDYSVQDHVTRIGEQDTVSGATYDQLLQLTSVDLDITRENFVRTWKTIILKRVQDIYEKEKHIRPQNYVRINRAIVLPGPLADVVHALGAFHSTVTGRIHHITPPARAAAPPNWWDIDGDIIMNWSRTMARLEANYVMKEFPSPAEWDKRPLMLTMRQLTVDNTFVSTKAWTNEPAPTDGYIRAIHDDLFDPHPYITYANCSLVMSPPLLRNQLVGEYVGGYVLKSNC